MWPAPRCPPPPPPSMAAGRAGPEAPNSTQRRRKCPNSLPISTITCIGWHNTPGLREPRAIALPKRGNGANSMSKPLPCDSAYRGRAGRRSRRTRRSGPGVASAPGSAPRRRSGRRFRRRPRRQRRPVRPGRRRTRARTGLMSHMKPRIGSNIEKFQAPISTPISMAPSGAHAVEHRS